MIDSIASAGIAAAAPQPKPAKVEDAAKQFEALMIAQLLKSARGSDDSSWMGTGDDQAGSIGVEMAEQEFARALASGGGLGLARLIAHGLAPAATSPASSDPPKAAEDTPAVSGG